MLDDNNQHFLTLNESLQKNILSLQKSHVIDTNLQMIQSLSTSLNRSLGDNDVVKDAIIFAMSVKDTRHASLLDFQSRLTSSTPASSSWPLDSVTIIPSNQSHDKNERRSDDLSSASEQHIEVTSLQFKQQYLYKNIPCLINNLDKSEFSPVSEYWIKREGNTIMVDSSTTIPATKIDSRINTDWFLQHVGPSTIVPVRQISQHCRTKISGYVYYRKDSDEEHYNNSGNEVEDVLDEDGRATECETIQVSMVDWINFVSKFRDTDNKYQDLKVGNEVRKFDSTLYLKDWHLQNILASRWRVGAYEDVSASSTKTHDTSSDHEIHDFSSHHTYNTLYTIPQIFSGDVFNPFLLSNKGGDYRFVYWGAKGSYTSIHSDVLHTFSWSFNCWGTKRWVFYPPITYDDTKSGDNQTSNNMDDNSFEIIQTTGQMIYVPSGWKHSVYNLEETLSINHNWITISTLDRMYQCILSEIKAIDQELMEWGLKMEDNDGVESDVQSEEITMMDLDFYRMREDMLRGCVGLDITSFCVMAFGCLTDCLLKLLTGNANDLWEYCFDFTCVVNVLTSLLLHESNEEASLPKQTTCNLPKRLCATLGRSNGKTVYTLLVTLTNECNSLIKMMIT